MMLDGRLNLGACESICVITNAEAGLSRIGKAGEGITIWCMHEKKKLPLTAQHASTIIIYRPSGTQGCYVLSKSPQPSHPKRHATLDQRQLLKGIHAPQPKEVNHAQILYHPDRVVLKRLHACLNQQQVPSVQMPNTPVVDRGQCQGCCFRPQDPRPSD